MNVRTTLPTDPNHAGGPRNPRSGRGPLLIVVGVVVVGAIAAAVLLWPKGDDELQTTTSSTVVPTTAAPDPEAATRAAVLDAYRNSFDQFVAVASDPNGLPEDPRLAEHTMGNALFVEQATIFRLRKDGQVFTGSVELHPTVVELGAGTATVTDCGIDRTATVEIQTGKVLSPPGTEGHAATAKLRIDASGVWKEYEFKDEKRSCVPPAS